MTLAREQLTHSEAQLEGPNDGKLLPELDKNLLHNLLMVQSHSRSTAAMTKFIRRFAQRNGGRVVEDQGNLYVTKGEGPLYPCVVAHTDTVHAIVPNDEYSIYKLRDKNSDHMLWFGWNPKEQTFTGVGGDDKVGIYLALMALRTFDSIKLAFFRDEEIGCVGSALADMDFFSDVTLVMQGDRRGNDDFVKSIYGDALSSTDFLNAVRPILSDYGYRLSTGAMTDVHELKTSGLSVSCANFSCGYYDPHTSGEYIDESDLQNTLGMVYTVINTLGDKVWSHEYTRRSYTSAAWTDSEWNATNYKGWSEYDTEIAETSYKTVSDDGPTLDNDFDAYIRLSAEGDCPMCKCQDLIEYDDDLGLYYCERCVVYINPAN